MNIITDSLRNKLGREQFLRSVVVGIIIGLFEVIFAISFAGLLFSGPLHHHLADGIGIVLITVIVSPIITGILSPTIGMVANIQGSFIIILNVALASFISSSSVPPQAVLPTLMTIISMSTIFTGLLFFTLGYFRLTRLVHYVPYPVIGGFLAGTGWLMIRGAMSTMIDLPLDLRMLPVFFRSPQLILWLPGVLIGAGLWIGLQRIKHFLALPVLLVVGFVIFYAVMHITGTSIQAGVDNGLLLGEFGTVRWQPLSITLLVSSDWQEISAHFSTIVTSIIIALITVILYVSGMEVSLKQDMDVNGELQASGIANIVSGFLGGSVGLPSIPLTTLSSRLNALSRLTGVIAGVVALIVLLFGSVLLVLIPKAVLGGLLLFMGFSFINEWIIEGYSKFTRSDYGIVWLILFAIALIGFLEGVAVGIMATILVFVVNYSQMSIFYRKRPGSEIKSHVERSAYHAEELKRQMKKVYVLELQGFLFFGTTTGLLEVIRERFADSSQPPLEYIILDFRRVGGVDASAVLTFSKAIHWAYSKHIMLVFTGINDTIKAQFAFLGKSEHQEELHLESSLEYGLEWCEKMLLDFDSATEMQLSSTLLLQLCAMGMEKQMAQRLETYLEMRQLSPQEYLMRQGDDSNDLYFIQKGQVSTFIENEDGRGTRLHTMTRGTVVGEMSYYLKTKRSASVIADMYSTVYRLSAITLDQMRTQDPELALTVSELMTQTIAYRLVSTNEALAATI